MVSTVISPAVVKSTPSKKNRTFQLLIDTSDQCTFRLNPIPGFAKDDFRGAWHFVNLRSLRGDEYDVAQLHDGSFQCDCKGFLYHGACKHVQLIARLQSILCPCSVAVRIID